MRDNTRIPFSWTLLFIALLHFSVYSIGVCETHSRDFFLRENTNQKLAYSLGSESIDRLVPSQVLEFFSFAQVEQQIKSLEEREEADKNNSADKLIESPRPASIATSFLLLFAAFAASEADSTAENNANKAANAAAQTSPARTSRTVTATIA